MCYSKRDRERWEQMLAREADEERLREVEIEPQPQMEQSEPERDDEREGELIRI